jgi:hypothetical protein
MGERIGLYRVLVGKPEGKDHWGDPNVDDKNDTYLTAIGLTPGDSSTVHIYTQTVHRIQRTEHA